MTETLPDSNQTPYDSHEQAESETADLAEELRNRTMFCLHGITADDLGINSLVGGETGLEERFRAAVVDRPAMSAVIHTEQATTSKAPLWSSIGVVIGGGAIQAASPSDMGSRMVADGRRDTIEQSPEEVREALDTICANDAKYPDYPLHNEVVVDRPIVTGFYFKDTAGLMDNQINRDQVNAEPNTVPPLVRTMADQYKLPIFAVRTSGVYEVKEFDPETGKYRFSAETAPRVHPGEVISQPGTLSEDIALAGALAVGEMPDGV